MTIFFSDFLLDFSAHYMTAEIVGGIVKLLLRNWRWHSHKFNKIFSLNKYFAPAYCAHCTADDNDGLNDSYDGNFDDTL